MKDLDNLLDKYIPFYTSNSSKTAYFNTKKPDNFTITPEAIPELQSLEYELKTKPIRILRPILRNKQASEYLVSFNSYFRLSFRHFTVVESLFEPFETILG